MSLNDLQNLLQKEEVIATFGADALRKSPDSVDFSYRRHARTHVPLGETEKHLETIWKWLGGPKGDATNKGAFIGGVIGNYGEGKTAFQVHIWEQCDGQKILAVPPFSWHSVAQMLDGVAAWVDYRTKGQPEANVAAKKLFERFREKSLREVAEETARSTGRDVDEIYSTLRDLAVTGAKVDSEVTPDQFLDFLAELEPIIKSAGFNGLLVLLDEPEVAGRVLGEARVSQILFDLANGVAQRQGNYGVFISLPDAFLASAQRMFASLVARLQKCGCLPRLRDSYGADFAPRLWTRYLENFGVSPAEAGALAFPVTLEAIGQVASSARVDLAYGPRTVITALRRVVAKGGKDGPYLPADFSRDALDQEIVVSPDYRSKVSDSLKIPGLSQNDKDLIWTLAAFPDGITKAQSEALGVREDVEALGRAGNVLIKTGGNWGLISLRRGDSNSGDADELLDTIRTVMSEFRPEKAVAQVARGAFERHLVPRLFPAKSGQALQGFERVEGRAEWVALPSLEGARGLIQRGAWAQTVRDYPARTLAVVLSDPAASAAGVQTFYDGDKPMVDLVWQVAPRWNPESEVPVRRIEDFKGDPSKKKPLLIRLNLEWSEGPITHERLADVFDPRLLTPLGVLFLLGEMDKRLAAFSYQNAQDWNSLREQLLRALFDRWAGEVTEALAAANQGKEVRPMLFTERIAALSQRVFKQRYPAYSTLIKTPQWKTKVNDYVRILNGAGIPLSAKRGNEMWSAPTAEVARTFGSSPMNLPDSFNSYESLITIRKSKTNREETEVEFQRHPLETQLMGEIEKSDKRGEFDSRECPYISVFKMLPMLVSSGYTQDEVSQVVEIGKARGTFKAGEAGGKPVLYCPPLDPEQMKARRREGLQLLREMSEAAATFPGYEAPLDLDAVAADIEKIDEEGRSDALRIRIEGAIEKHGLLISGQLERSKQFFIGLRNDANALKTEFERSCDISTLPQLPTGASKWVSDLGRYVTNALRADAKDIADAADQLGVDVTKGESSCTTALKQAPKERTESAVKIFTFAAQRQEDMNRINMKKDSLLSSLRDYDSWKRLVLTSDALLKSIGDLATAHPEKSKSLRNDFDKISDAISTHFETRFVGGLSAHAQFETRIRELSEGIVKFQSQLRDEFFKEKERVEAFLHDAGVASNRLEVTPDAGDLADSRRRLYELAQKAAQDALAREAGELREQTSELRYARDILRRVPGEACAPVLERVEAAQGTLCTGLDAATADKLREAVAQLRTSDNITLQELKAGLNDARTAIRDAKTLVREASVAAPSELSPVASEMQGLLPDTGPRDLKELVLAILESGKTGDIDATQALDRSLEALGELFRAGTVQIRVEKPRR